MERKIYKQLDIDTFNKVALGLSKKKKESQPIIMCFPLNPRGARELQEAIINVLTGRNYDTNK
jgi:hypothetical protein